MRATAQTNKNALTLLTPNVAIMGTAMKYPMPDQVKRVPCGQWHTEVWSWPDVTPPRWASLAGSTREGHLQDGCHDVPLSSWSGTSVPRRPFHHVLRRRFSASSAFCKPSPAHCTSLSSEHIWPSGVFNRPSDGLELAAWRAQRSGVWFWQF